MRARRSLTVRVLASAGIALALGACATSGSDTGTGAGGAAPVACSPDGTAEYCYPGPAASRGVGQCRDGTRICQGGVWGECGGFILPIEEICDDYLDNNCNGTGDEGCACQPGSTRPCYTGPAATQGLGICRDGEQRCVDEKWSAECTGEVLPAADEPCNELDDNCNGLTDDGCACPAGATRACYSGPPATANIGRCRDGTQTCPNGQWDTQCVGELTPSPDICNQADDDCDGATDEELGETTCGIGPCQRTVPNCLDGVPQTCTPPCDGVHCTSGAECSSTFCQDGQCCDAACNAACQSCATGTCSAVVNADDNPECTGAYTCDASASCKKKLGQPCGAPGECVNGVCKDSRCCGSACNAACQSCASGSCVAVVNADDNPECTGAYTCDASAACKLKIGQPCGAPGECVNGVCKDGRCCGSACNAACQSCASGSCVAVVNADDNPECTGAYSCDAGGACRLKSGQTCVNPSDCVSGVCSCDKYMNCYCG